MGFWQKLNLWRRSFVVRKRFFQKFLTRRTPFKLLILGFATYVALGLSAISLPCCRRADVGFLDHLFNVVSATSTTGLCVGSIGEIYTFWGNLVLLTLIQCGGIGYMTLTSCLILARGDRLSPTRKKILGAEFALPDGFSMKEFVVSVGVYSLFVETIGAWLLWREFKIADVANPLWQGIFHSISAFGTAGFSLFSNGLTDFKDNIAVNVVVMALSWAGAIGFIVPADVWSALRRRRETITLTSKTILWFSLGIFVLGTAFYSLTEAGDSNSTVLTAAFQISAASTTAGFNTIDVGKLAPATLTLLMLVMLIGASPSGTGGGVKTTTISALAAILGSVARGRPDKITFWNKTIPPCRVFTAVAVATIYLAASFVGLTLLCATERAPFISLCFETLSAIGTVGVTTGITNELTAWGKIVVATLMFVGRVGPLTIGLAVWFNPNGDARETKEADLAV